MRQILPCLLLLSLFAAGCATPDGPAAPASLPASPGRTAPVGPVGPTIALDYGLDETAGNAIAHFMYFVPLISPDPVSRQESPGNQQQARVLSARREVRDNQIRVVCDFEITGTGFQENRFDYSKQIRRHDQRLREGKSLDKMLSTITVRGMGQGRIEVDGVLTNDAPVVNEVRLRFNARGESSPVFIELHDIVFRDGKIQSDNELVAQVNTLSFARTTRKPRMGVSLASVKRASAGDGLFQNMVGRMTGAAANMLIKPIRVDRTGHEAMLDFGLALWQGDTTFTFPLARNLKSNQLTRNP